MRRPILIAALATVVATTGLAQAAPKGAGDEALAPPYKDTYSAQRTTCADGATCTGAQSVSDAGQVLATSDYRREETATGKEWQLAWGGVSFRHRTDPAAKQVVATFTWLVSAAASGDSSAGDVFGQALLETWSAGCGKGCTVTTDEYVVVDAGERSGVPFLVPGDADHPLSEGGYPARVEDERVEVTLTFAGHLPPWVEGRSQAVAATAGYPVSTPCGVERLCGVTGDVDSGHAGTAHSELDARLLSVTVDES